MLVNYNIISEIKYIGVAMLVWKDYILDKNISVLLREVDTKSYEKELKNYF